MCGIVGMIGARNVVPLLLNGLKRLEYRGYDSAGIAVLNEKGIERSRSKGKISALEEKITQSPIEGFTGIGHTRWATHGVPGETNAHPHSDGNVVVVHNGIIENYKELKAELQAKGCVFESETDTETVVHLLSLNLKEANSLTQAVSKTLKRLEGAYALGIIIKSEPEKLIFAKKGSPLAIGIGDNEMYLGSDAISLAPLTSKIMYLEDGDWGILSTTGVKIYNEKDEEVKRDITSSKVSKETIEKGEYNHFMLKEIIEQPKVILKTLNSFVNRVLMEIKIEDIPFNLKEIEQITIVACGTSYYAANVAKYWIEEYAGINVSVDIASEFRYRNPPMKKGGLSIFISQSGETADTLAALKYCKTKGQYIASIVNVSESSIARNSDVVWQTLAGPEIGVASTKAFTTQLVVLASFALLLAKSKDLLPREKESNLISNLLKIPEKIDEFLSNQGDIKDICNYLSRARDVLYLGRGLNYPIAMEGALKLKEISYIHAESYAAGEMKHGPIALIDENVPVIVIAPKDSLYEKTVSNIEEVISRNGKVILLSDKNGLKGLKDKVFGFLELPECDNFSSPLLYAVSVQLLAYYTALMMGKDVDKPRNLAKSVTVE